MLPSSAQRARRKVAQEGAICIVLENHLTLALALQRGYRGLMGPAKSRYSKRMEVHVTPETARKLNDLAATSGRAPSQIVEDALAGYLEEVATVRKTLDSRYDDLESGRVKPIDGEEAFTRLREESERRRSGG